MPASFYGRKPKIDRSRYRHQLYGSVYYAPRAPAVMVPPLEAPPASGRPGGPQNRRVAILCCGPSVRETWSELMFPSFDCVIAVNDAGQLFAHHWIVGSDGHILKPILEGVNRRPLVGALTNRAWVGRFQAIGLQAIRPDTFDQNGPFGRAHTTYSFVAALWFALKEAGPYGHVHVHGFDASQTPSVTGIDRFHSHRPARWRQEAEKLKVLWDASRITNHGKAPGWLLDFLCGRKADCCP